MSAADRATHLEAAEDARYAEAARWSPPRRTATSAPSRRRCARARLDEVIGQDRVREQLAPGARGRPRPRAARPTTCCSPARPGSARPRWR